MLLGGLWIYGSTGLSQLSSIAGIGPGVFVTLIGIGLVLCGATLVFQMVLSADGPAPPPEDGAEIAPFRPGAFAVALLAVAAPLVLMKQVGFPVTAAIVFAGVTYAFGSRRVVKDFLIGAVLSVVSWFLFHWLGVDLGGFLPLLGF
jgi:putative tricarboxylic transport membrane protein